MPNDSTSYFDIYNEIDNESVKQYITEYPYEIDAYIVHGGTFLHYYLERQHKDIEMINFLLECNANPNKKDSFSNTALHYAVKDNDKSLVKLLLANGANPNISNKSGNTPLHWCCDPNIDFNIPQNLISYGADINKKNNEKLSVKELASNTNTQFAEYIKTITIHG